MRTAKAARQSLDALRAEVEAMLIEREKVPPAVPWASTLRSKLQQPPDVTLRAQWLLSEGRSNDALALATGPNQCHPQRLLDVAATLGVSRHAEAFALIDRVAQQTIQRTTGRYDEAIDLVSQACARLGSGAARQYLERLRVEYKAKRNFVKGIDALHRPASAA